MKKRLLTLALGVALTGLGPTAFAITAQEFNAGIQFNFGNPGARSLGMGGTYLGFSDDATAAYTNPAGLTILGQKEVALEIRHSRFSTPYVAGGNVTLPVDDADVFLERSKTSETVTPAYFAFVYPMDRFSLALFRSSLADFSSRIQTREIPLTGPSPALTGRIFPIRAELDFSVENTGAAVGFKVNDQFALGLSIMYSQFATEGASVRTIGPNNFVAEGQAGEDEDWVYNLGALWKLNSQWSIGAAYRRGGGFEYDVAFLNSAGNVVRAETGFNVPHQFGVGVTFRPTDALSVGLDVNHVGYSRISDDFLDIFGGGDLGIDDGVEIRLGGEYVFTQFQNPFTVRAGVFRDPDHVLAYEGPLPPQSLADVADQVLFRPGKDRWHYSAGFGWVFGNFQLDAGASFSNLVDTVSVSGVLRF